MYQEEHSNHDDTDLVAYVAQEGLCQKCQGPGYKSVKSDMGITDPTSEEIDRLGESSRSITAKFSGILQCPYLL